MADKTMTSFTKVMLLESLLTGLIRILGLMCEELYSSVPDADSEAADWLRVTRNHVSISELCLRKFQTLCTRLTINNRLDLSLHLIHLGVN